MQPFGNAIPIDYFLDVCQNVFGVDLNVLQDGVERTNILYGAKNITATKVINVHGANDPWHRAGIVNGDIDKLSPTIVIDGASHCQDLSSANNLTDTPQLFEAKERIKRLIREWLNKKDEDIEDSGAKAVCLNLILIVSVMLLPQLL